MYILLFLFTFFLCVIVDARISDRPLVAQLNWDTLALAPLQVALHYGTPAWLRKALHDASGILKPTTQIFPNLTRIRAALPIIQTELDACLFASKPIRHDMYFHGLSNDGWKRFYIKWYGPPDPLAIKLCPQTVALLNSMPEVHLAMFSILQPRTRILMHFGPTRMCLRYHLGIRTPNNAKCAITLGSRSYVYKDGEDVILDDTRMHFVENNTDQTRVILFLDIERPQVPWSKPLAQFLIRTLGPMTTRTNDAREGQFKVQQ